MVLQLIKKKSAESLTVDSLRNAITTGQLAAGQRITEASLSESFGVSRGTVRIALYQLMQEGIVVQTPYTGWAVMQLTPRDVWELYTLRASLESLSAKLAGDQIDAKGKRQLSKAFDDLMKACDKGVRADVAAADFELHRTIVEMAQHSRLSAHYQLVEQQFKIFLLASTYTSTRIEGTISDHQPIVDAILAGNGQLAAQLTQQHNIAGGDRLYGVLQESAANSAAS